MNCEKFIEWLNEGNSTRYRNELPQQFIEHVTNCSKCRQSLSVQNSEVEKLKKQVTLRSEDKMRIFGKLKKQIADSQTAKPFSLSALLSDFFPAENRKWAFSGFTFILLLSSLAIISLLGSSNETVAYVVGDGTLIRNSVSIQLSKQQIPVFSGDRLQFDGGSSTIAWDNKDQLQIEGTAGFVVGDNMLTMHDGEARVAFKPSAKGYIVAMNHSLFVIVGTVLQLQTSQDEDSIHVVEGKIEWQQKNSEEKGFLAAGQGLNISATQVSEILQSELKAHQNELDEPLPTSIELLVEPVLDVSSDPILPD